MKLLGADRFDTLNAETLKFVAGMMLTVLGGVGLAIYFIPYSSTAFVRLQFASAVAFFWGGIWLTAKRIPSMFLTCAWIGAMIAIWQARNGTLPF